MDIHLLETLADHEVEKMDIAEMEEIIYDSKLDNFQTMTDDEVIAYIIDKHGINWFEAHGYDRPKTVHEFDQPI